MAEKNLELPCGVVLNTGHIEKHVTIRKMKARVQREVASLVGKKNPNPTEVLDFILTSSVTRFGEEDGLRPKYLTDMLLADRDWLLFQIRIHTHGPLTDVEQECAKCEEKYTYPDFDLSSFPLKAIDKETVLWWDGNEVLTPDKVRFGEIIPCRVFVLQNEEAEARGVFRYPNGSDQRDIASLGNKPVEALWRLLVRTCMLWEDAEHGVSKGKVKAELWDDLDIDVMDWLQAAFAEAMPGLDTTSKLTCPEGHESEVRVSAADFLFRSSVKRRSPSIGS